MLPGRMGEREAFVVLQGFFVLASPAQDSGGGLAMLAECPEHLAACEVVGYVLQNVFKIKLGQWPREEEPY